MPVYKNKKNNKYFISRRINGKQLTIRRDKNNNQFKTRKEAVDYENEFFRMSSSIYIRDMNKKIDKIKNVILNEIKDTYKITSYYQINIYFNKYFMPFFGEMKLSKINNDVLLIYKNKIINFKNYDNSISPIHILKMSKTILKSLTKIYNIELNLNILNLRNKNQSRIKCFEYYDENEFKSFISVISDKRDKLLFNMLFYYGLRVGELRALNSQSFDFHSNQLHIQSEATTKAGVGKTIIISPKTKSSIRSYPILDFIKEEYINIFGLNYAGFIFGSKNKIIGLSTIYRKNMKYAKLANLPKIRIHDFRHSCAILLYKNGFDSASIAKWLGHSSTAVTETTYIHYRSNVKDKIKDFIEENNVIKIKK